MSEKFEYSYSAEQQQEIEEIRRRYLPQGESKLDLLRRLDESATRPGTIASIAVGILSTLLLGVGMCCCMLWAGRLFIPGIIVGVIGIAGIAAAFPLYSRITKKRREKLAPEILRLTDELSQK